MLAQHLAAGPRIHQGAAPAFTLPPAGRKDKQRTRPAAEQRGEAAFKYASEPHSSSLESRVDTLQMKNHFNSQDDKNNCELL